MKRKIIRIGISLLSARPQRTGVENAAFNLITQLSRMDGEAEYVVYANTRNLPWLCNLSGHIRVVDVRFSPGRSLWMWEHLFFLTNRHAKEVDVVHFPIGGGVVGYRRTFVLTIHDLKHYSNRELVKLRRYFLWRVWCKANVKRAARIITVSEHVKAEICQAEVPPWPDAGDDHGESGSRAGRALHGRSGVTRSATNSNTGSASPAST